MTALRSASRTMSAISSRGEPAPGREMRLLPDLHVIQVLFCFPLWPVACQIVSWRGTGLPRRRAFDEIVQAGHRSQFGNQLLCDAFPVRALAAEEAGGRIPGGGF